MKRFVTLAFAVLIGCFNCSAQSVSSVIQKYSSTADAEKFSIDRKTFNLIKPLLPLDRQTKKALKALNISSMDVLSIGKCPKATGDAISRELSALADSGQYQIASKEASGLILLKASQNTVSEFVMMEFDASQGALMLLRADCAADLEELSTLSSGSGHD